MKTIFILILGVVVGYLVHSTNAGSANASYNESGKRIVVGTCSKDQDCFMSIGNQCEENGYKVLTRGYDNESSKVVITVQCGEPKKIGLFSL